MGIRGWYALCLAAMALASGGCGSSQLFEAVPAGLDRTAVHVVTATMTAKHFEFIPDTIRVPAGSLLKLSITSTDGTHGFALGAFGIDEKLVEGVTREVEVYAQRKGAYPFHCSHLCGFGHFGMDGVLIVE